MKTQSTTKGFAILSAAGMIVKLLSLLYVPFLLNIIGEEGYAVYSSAYIVFVFIYIVTNSGMSSAISKIVSELVALENYKDAIKSFKIARILMLILGTVMAVLMMLLAKPLANVTHFPKAYLAIAALAPAVLFTSLASAYRGYFQGRGNMKPTAVSQVIEQIFNIVFSLLFAALWMKHGIAAGCAGGTIGTTLGAMISAIYLMRYYKLNRAIKVTKGYSDREVIRYSNEELLLRIIKYSLPLTISWGLQNAGNLVDVSNTKGRLMAGGFDDTEGSIKYNYLAKYQVLINVPITIVSALCTAILPAISGAAALEEKGQVKRGITYAFKLCFLITIPSAVGLAVLSQPIFNMLFAKYSAGASIMRIGSVVLVLMSVVQIQTTILQSIGKLYLSTFFIVLGITIKIITNYILIAIPSINIMGAIGGSILGFLVPLILNDILIKKTLNIKFNIFKSAFRPLIASCLMGAAVYIIQLDIDYFLKFVNKPYMINALSTLIAVVIGGFIYLYVLILIGGINKKDLNSMPRKLTRIIPGFMFNRIR